MSLNLDFSRFKKRLIKYLFIDLSNNQNNFYYTKFYNKKERRLNSVRHKFTYSNLLHTNHLLL